MDAVVTLAMGNGHPTTSGGSHQLSPLHIGDVRCLVPLMEPVLLVAASPPSAAPRRTFMRSAVPSLFTFGGSCLMPSPAPTSDPEFAASGNAVVQHRMWARADSVSVLDQLHGHAPRKVLAIERHARPGLRQIARPVAGMLVNPAEVGIWKLLDRRVGGRLDVGRIQMRRRGPGTVRTCR